MHKTMYKSKLISSLLWKLLERFGISGIQFVLQIILARLLDPGHYGILALMIVFTSLANVFVQNGFNTALIQGRDVTEEDYSSVFWVSMGVSVLLYGVLFLTAPMIGQFYKMPGIVIPFRVLALIVIPGAFNSVQLAKISRQMDFKQVFLSSIGAISVSGIVGIALAYKGAGLWSLVVQNILNVLVTSIVMWLTVQWRPKLVCNLQRVKALLGFGWKLLVSALLETLYQDLRSLVIGKKYDSNTLGYYSRGKQFPQFIINAINGAVQSVMLPAMSAEQDDRKKVKTIMRHSVTLSAYVIFPMMAGLAGVATPLISLLLTDKWLPSVPYMQIYCFTLAFYPVHSSNLQAINAVGRSDIFLKLEVIKKGIGMIALVIALVFFDSPIAIAMTGVFTTIISFFVNAYPNKQLINYSYAEQVKDIVPSFVASFVMFFAVVFVGRLGLGTVATLLIQMICGVVVYVLISVVFKIEQFGVLKSILGNMLYKKNREN